MDLYNFVFPPSAAARGLAVIGLVQPIGSVAPISEMQARWAAAVLAGRLKLPSETEMRARIAARRCQMRRQYFESSKHTLQVNGSRYINSSPPSSGAIYSIYGRTCPDDWMQT